MFEMSESEALSVAALIDFVYQSMLEGVLMSEHELEDMVDAREMVDLRNRIVEAAKQTAASPD